MGSLSAKRLISFSALLALLFSALPFRAWADAVPSIALVVSDSAPKEGQSVDVTVRGDQLSDIFAYEFSVYYNPDELTYVEGSAKAGTPGFMVPVSASESGGHHLVFAFTKTGSTATLSGAADLATFSFAAKRTSNAAVTVKDVKLVRSDLSQTGLGLEANQVVYVNGGVSTPFPSGNPANTGTANEDKTLEVKAEQLGAAGSAPVAIAVPAGVTKLVMPADAGKLLAGKPVEVAASGLKLSIPGEVLGQLANSLAGAQLNGSRIVLEINAADQADKQLQAIASTSGAVIRQGAQLYDLELYLQTESGQKQRLTAFEKPITLRFDAETAMDPAITGIYYIADNAITYIGGKSEAGTVSADVSHFSRYGLLQVDMAFSDVPSGRWSYQTIRSLAAKQIVTGAGNGTFLPQRAVTRAEFTALLSRALKLEAPASSAVAFTDVPAGAWYAADVAKAVAAGLVQGQAASIFAPNAVLTREEAAVMLIRAYELNHGTTPDAEGGSVQGPGQDQRLGRSVRRQSPSSQAHARPLLGYVRAARHSHARRDGPDDREPD
ncbi:S-layer homology domain-containing protein [Cohnella rhizosphaerae]|uniref:S-layer homology domain-containing protein n=1 Tax=Cohnella rhizosphaerae TaxID=1457232 RepID=A0A9X4QUJ9_9BACL|nr:S-layer homology domain-containing protein [Cohnella rhizosphaerae]MDG0810552.1 S-layer homology domain-containing protein [Cohnella rhizosphaerae]